MGTEREQISSYADKKNAALICANKPDPASGGCKKISIYNSFVKYKHGTVILKILRMCRIKKNNAMRPL